MRAAGQIVLLAALTGGAALATQCAGDRARTTERRRWEQKLQAEAESTAAWRRRTDAARRDLERLRADAMRLHGELDSARIASATGRRAIRALAELRRAAGDPGAAVALEDAAAAVEVAEHACDSVIANCQAQLATDSGALADAERRINALALIQDTTAQKLAQAERRASPGFLGLRELWRAKEQLGLVVLVLLVLSR